MRPLPVFVELLPFFHLEVGVAASGLGAWRRWQW